MCCMGEVMGMWSSFWALSMMDIQRAFYKNLISKDTDGTTTLNVPSSPGDNLVYWGWICGSVPRVFAQL